MAAGGGFQRFAGEYCTVIALHYSITTTVYYCIVLYCYYTVLKYIAIAVYDSIVLYRPLTSYFKGATMLVFQILACSYTSIP